MPTLQQAPPIDELAPIISSLEQNLSQLDAIGTNIAAAHLNAAIHQLRRDQAHINGGCEAVLDSKLSRACHSSNS